VVCPDNGLITWAVRRMGVEAVREIAWRPENLSSTFHGRDVMAPVAGRLAAGESLDAMTCSMGDPVLLPVDMARRLEEARVIYIDHYGNAVTNVPGELVGKEIETVRTYADVEIGKPLALINSSGLLEIAVRNGSAAEILGLKVGSEIQI
jgi:S-adenosylmethionine hydrolase